MRTRLFITGYCVELLGNTIATAGEKEAQIASAENAGPPAVTAQATIKATDGAMLGKGSNGYT